jgi:hypothetical protein
MSWNKTALSALLAGAIFPAALAGNALAQVRVPPGTIQKAPRQEPCWEVAGVTRAALQQRRTLARQARQEAEAVCANSSLSMQQKRQQIQQIHQRERQEIDAIITPAQQDAMRSCEEQRHGVHRGGGGHAGGGHGPCGEMPVGHKAAPLHEDDEVPPNETPHPN